MAGVIHHKAEVEWTCFPFKLSYLELIESHFCATRAKSNSLHSNLITLQTTYVNSSKISKIAYFCFLFCFLLFFFYIHLNSLCSSRLALHILPEFCSMLSRTGNGCIHQWCMLGGTAIHILGHITLSGQGNVQRSQQSAESAICKIKKRKERGVEPASLHNEPPKIEPHTQST